MRILYVERVMSKKKVNEQKDSQLPNPPKRIETQIHRRKKAKAVSPLTNEWESSQTDPPKGLKRPTKDMRNS